jgi:hypothetical protein
MLERIRMLEQREGDEKLALERISLMRWKNKERFEKEHARTVFRGTHPPGTLVLVRNSSIEKELDCKHKPRWLGPMVVVRRTRGGSYILADEDGAVSATRYATFRVIKYHLRTGLSFAVDDFVSQETLARIDEELVRQETRLLADEAEEVEDDLLQFSDEDSVGEHIEVEIESKAAVSTESQWLLPEVDDEPRQ